MKIRKLMVPIAALLLLAACNNSATESSTSANNEPENNSISQNANEENATTESAEAANTNNTNTTEREKDSSANDDKVSQKEEYLTKLNAKKKEMDVLRKNPEDDSTYALKKVEGERYKAWDDLLNEIYGVLQKQLSSEEMEQLKQEQREWIENRDSKAKEASLKYEGGTMEQLEYVAVLADLTEERCFALVEGYMK
ncbi:lysozyme inhibitor LprI family protein [Niallia taxi]|nr:lysozyme inhibitor LprI family protein [Niallia taxi]MDE5054943.1 lysozyme inhibitor LprI family protein [Niallia taxi]